MRARYRLSSCAQPKRLPQAEPENHTASSVMSARGTMSALPVVASSTVPSDTPSRLAGTAKLRSCRDSKHEVSPPVRQVSLGMHYQLKAAGQHFRALLSPQFPLIIKTMRFIWRVYDSSSSVVPLGSPMCHQITHQLCQGEDYEQQRGSPVQQVGQQAALGIQI